MFVANSNQANEVLVTTVWCWSRRESGRWSVLDSFGGFVFDATGDGTGDDVFVANNNQANEVMVHDGAGGVEPS